MTLLVSSSCKDEGSELSPGLYLESETYEVYKGETIHINGTASNFSGLSSIVVFNEELQIKETIDLSSQAPTVFNFNFEITLPMSTDKDEMNLTVSVIDVNSKNTNKDIHVKFIKDVTPPQILTELPANYNVDYLNGKGSFTIKFDVSDDRLLSSIKLSIEETGYNEMFNLEGTSYSFEKEIILEQIGIYNLKIEVFDGEDNRIEKNVQIIVAEQENEDSIDDYECMYMIVSSENVNDYIEGYYHYMNRVDEYKYSCKILIKDPKSAVAFTSEEKLDGNYWGVSPNNPTKLLNKNGYVNDITINETGYYNVDIDINNHTFSIEKYEPNSSQYTQMCVYGSGFGFGSWVDSEVMTKIDGTYSWHITFDNVPAGEQILAFKDKSTQEQWKCPERKGWYKTKNGANLKFTSGESSLYVEFDTEIPWAIVKKTNN